MPDVALKHIGDTQKKRIVFVGDHSQVGEGILDFHTTKKLDAAINRIGNFFLSKYLFDGSRDVMSPIEYGHVPIWRSFFVKLLNFNGNKGPLPWNDPRDDRERANRQAE